MMYMPITIVFCVNLDMSFWSAISRVKVKLRPYVNKRVEQFLKYLAKIKLGQFTKSYFKAFRS